MAYISAFHSFIVLWPEYYGKLNGCIGFWELVTGVFHYIRLFYTWINLWLNCDIFYCCCSRCLYDAFIVCLAFVSLFNISQAVFPKILNRLIFTFLKSLYCYIPASGQHKQHLWAFLGGGNQTAASLMCFLTVRKRFELPLWPWMTNCNMLQTQNDCLCPASLHT